MNQIDLNGRVAIITGGAQGIGYAAAQRMLNSGDKVVLWDMDALKLVHAKGELSALGEVSTAVVELTDDAAVSAAAAAVIAAQGRIDILVNNAGITGGNGATWELDPAVWRKVIEVNLVAPFLTCRAVAPQMVAQGYAASSTSPRSPAKRATPTPATTAPARPA